MSINPILFYLAEVFSDIQIIAMSIMIIISSSLAISYFIYFTENDKFFNDFNKRAIVILLISMIICVVMPNKETSIEMIIASQITEENAETAKEVVDYIIEKINDTKGE